TQSHTTPHPASPATATQTDPRGAPSFITARNASFRAVSGSALIAGWRKSGNLAYEKKVPDSSHIGSITRFIIPDTPSIVFGREATSSPTPAKDSDPISATMPRLTIEPWTATPKTTQPKMTTIATSNDRKTSRDIINESRK